MQKPKVPKLSNALVTACNGFFYLTIRQFSRNQGVMRIRADKIDPEEKRLSLWRGQTRGGW